MQRPKYPGGKGGEGVFAFLLNWLKPTDRYVSLFAGYDALLWNLREKPNHIWINDINVEIGQTWRTYLNQYKGEKIISSQDYQEVLYQLQDDYFVNQLEKGVKTTIFIDPPYMMETRSSQRKRYKREFSSAEEHQRLIENLIFLNQDFPEYQLMITHYPCEMYSQLKDNGFEITEFDGYSHNGRKTEWLITNYQKPTVLHDYSKIGDTNLKRLDIKRVIANFCHKYRKLDPVIQNAILKELDLECR